ncbi:hypothetical protein P879_11837 [Paragonimus westermani]|uniref:Uncharacterized protein n=1 Tax=Paragonimus westermani TaxID=34504 RepID=A0A8T0D3T0_9TREM|nr:hypothetical protein P879_11837 [Paragonimus westermani]
MCNIEAENNAHNYHDTKDRSAKHDLGQLFHESTSSESKQKPTVNSVDLEEPNELNIMTGDILNTSADTVKNAEDSHNTDGCKVLAEEQIEEVTKKVRRISHSLFKNTRLFQYRELLISV